MYKCNFCGYESDNIEDFEEDFQNHLGVWCPYCDGFTSFDQTRNHFSLILESKTFKTNSGVSHVPFKTTVSPLRYPGGKSKLVGEILSHCNQENMIHFVEPFCGGASVGLSLLLASKVKELYLNDLDYGIYSIFEVIKTCPYTLLERIESFVPSKESYIISQSVLKNGYAGLDMVDAAWHLLVVNRLAFSGISKASCMRNPSVRWKKETLQRRILDIHSCADHLHVSCLDACELIEEMYWKSNTTIFIDPPYVKKGKSLYLKYYQEKEHEQLSFLLDELYKGMPGADIILTYDDCEFIREQYRYPEVEELYRTYSISN